MSEQLEVGVIGSEASATLFDDPVLSSTVLDNTVAHNVQISNAAMERRVLDLAWPVISENFLETLLGIVDTWLVSSLGAVALAGVGTAIQFMFFIISALSAVSVGSAVLVAQSVGARDLVRAGNLAKQSLVWSLIISIPLSLIGLFNAHTLVSIFGMEQAVTDVGAAYLRVTMGTVVVLVMLIIGGGVLRGAGDSRTPMLVTAFANVVNVGLAYVLIFGKLGLPAMGAVGSAWATFIARFLALILLLFALWQGRKNVTIRGGASWWPDWQVARQVLQIGVPAAVEQMLMSSAFLVMTTVISHLGTLALAAQRVAMNAMSLSFLPAFGFSIAATALVGQSVGARRPEEGQAAASIATRWAMIWMSCLGVIFLLFAPQIMRFFSDDPGVVTIGAAGLRVVALTQPFWALGFVNAGALRGTGNTQYPLRVNAVGIWAAVGLGAFFVAYFSPSLSAVWAAFLITSPITSFLLWRRFRQG
ncbi:MAG: MATE family efflux transporter [Caldilineaceae bacterium]